MAVIIASVEPGSPAQRAGVAAGMGLISINGQPIRDVLDYRFYMTDPLLDLRLETEQGPKEVRVRKAEYDDLGLAFDTYLMDRQHHCRNKCIFCFVDQLPRGLRDTLYFKDDDSRMSFLFGSYVTLTNQTEEDIRRIIKMHISPINISVHTTNPRLRVEMLGNPRSGEVLDYIPMLTEAGIQVNTQLVLCPGVNDGPELRRSLHDLARYAPNLQSIALVPVGLTCHRDGLHPLRPLTGDEARDILDLSEEFNRELVENGGRRLAFAADELFLIAGRPFPGPEYYGDFHQLEDGVGLSALLRQEFLEELDWAEASDISRETSAACGTAAQPLLRELSEALTEKFPGVRAHVYGVPNRLFGHSVNVTGLLCGRDIIDHLRGKPLGEALLLSSVMLRHEGRFLDDLTPADVEAALGVPVRVVDGSGGDLLDAWTRG